jgi:5'-3' exonuclease
LFIRVFSAIPTLNEDGQHVGGLSGFMKSLGATIRMVKPTRVVVVFDGKGGSHRRRKIFDNYKERRAIKSRLNRAVGFEDLADEQASMKWQMVRLYEYLQNLTILKLMMLSLIWHPTSRKRFTSYPMTEIFSNWFQRR